MFASLASVIFAWVDVTILGGSEYYSILLYRAKVISPRVNRMVIVQQDLSFKGTRIKDVPSSVVEKLRESIADVTVIPVKGNAMKSLWQREFAVRAHAVQYVAEHVKNDTVYISDVDEIPDPSRAPYVGRDDRCIRLNLQFSYYSPLCVISADWSAGTMIHTSSKEFQAWKTQKNEHTLNGWVRGSRCSATTGTCKYGWHLSYAMDTKNLRAKMATFAHANDAMILNTARKSDLHLETLIRECKDLYGRSNIRMNVSDDYLPPAGWPQHPLAPTRVAHR